jgi:ubiquinol-cytochrome c reductase core subunit 2
MISRAALSRGVQLAARRQAAGKLAQRCSYASSAPASFAYETTDVAGVKVATRDSNGPTTKLAIVAKGGTRYQPAPGLTVGLEGFAFKAGL